LQKQKKIHFMRKYLFYICLEVVSNFFCWLFSWKSPIKISSNLMIIILNEKLLNNTKTFCIVTYSWHLLAWESSQMYWNWTTFYW
jgi:hypothetical protein